MVRQKRARQGKGEEGWKRIGGEWELGYPVEGLEKLEGFAVGAAGTRRCAGTAGTRPRIILRLGVKMV